MVAPGLRDRRAQEAELVGMAIGAEIQEAVAVVDVVLLVVDTLGDAGERILGRRGIEEPAFGGGVAANLEQEKRAVARAADTEVEALVWLIKHLNGAEKERGGVSGPGERADALGGSRKQRTGF